jgi:hypothetical protein
MRSSRFYFAAFLLVTSGMAVAGKPTVGAKPQEIFYRAPAGKGTQLVAAARDGSNVSSLFSGTGSLYFNFDVGAQPGSSGGTIVIGTRAGELQLLTYAKNSSGAFARTGLTTLLSGISSGTSVDLSPDGNRIAYRAGDGTHLRVYNITDHSDVEWSAGPWAWDFAWARGGASIALLEQTNPVDGRSHLYEVTGPGQRTEILTNRYMDRVEVSRTDGNLLLLSYNSEDGQQTFVGTWRMPTANEDGTTTPGAWINPAIVGGGTTFVSRGVLSCDDSYLLYGGSGPAGQQIWFTKTLPSGTPVQITKVGSNAEPQSWSSCAPSTTANDAFQFREVKP